MIAAEAGHTRCVDLLISYSARRRTFFGKTALMFACEGGHTDCARALVDTEARMVTSGQRTALMFAAAAGHLDCAALLVETEAGLRDTWGQTALALACRAGHASVVSLLVAREYNVSPRRPLLTLCINAESTAAILRHQQTISAAAAPVAVPHRMVPLHHAPTVTMSPSPTVPAPVPAPVPATPARQPPRLRLAKLPEFRGNAGLLRALAAVEATDTQTLLLLATDPELRPGFDALSAMQRSLVREVLARRFPNYYLPPEPEASGHADANPCVVCLDRPCGTALTPCGHVVCTSCAAELLKRAANCPVCRQTLNGSLRIFIP
eukprot:gnl/Ergobibamus_cyprinoides/879.p1 GENE.gnl/Ergobibamus_cyprinoides/879~~gnl/Ergobibamus_cyprinoides/879.p1  ORF type:complete len:366 (+),score=68.54 gnl/Ergobibamus_cyprinoides/879:134-1099(+)